MRRRKSLQRWRRWSGLGRLCWRRCGRAAILRRGAKRRRKRNYDGCYGGFRWRRRTRKCFWGWRGRYCGNWTRNKRFTVCSQQFTVHSHLPVTEGVWVIAGFKNRKQKLESHFPAPPKLKTENVELKTFHTHFQPRNRREGSVDGGLRG